MSFFPASPSAPYHHRRGSDVTSLRRLGSSVSTKGKSESAFAPLFRLVKDPAAAFSSAFVLDEATKRHQLASARLKNVCFSPGLSANRPPALTALSGYRRRTSTTGKMLRTSWICWKETKRGNRSHAPRTTTTP